MIDARGCVVSPGLVDLAASLREPGYEHKATLASEAAGRRGGITTTVLCTPDTNPVIDNSAVVELIHRMARKLGQTRILTTGALTRGLMGEQLGDGRVETGRLCRRQQRAPRWRRRWSVAPGVCGDLRPDGIPETGRPPSARRWLCTRRRDSHRLGLPAIPSAAESVAVARDLALAEHTQAKVHFRALSTLSAARMIHEAQAAGLAVTADVAAHQLHLTEMDVDDFNAECHVSPSPRTLTDRDALRRALPMAPSRQSVPTISHMNLTPSSARSRDRAGHLMP